MPVIESLIGIAELARLCRLDEAAIKGLVESGQTPAPLTLNGQLRFRASEIDRWMRIGCPDRKSFEQPVDAAAEDSTR